MHVDHCSGTAVNFSLMVNLAPITIPQLNTKRASMRRQPEHIETLNMPFNRDKFNFTKVKSEEIMFELVPEADEDCDEDDDMDHVLINGEELRNCKQNSGCSTEVRRDSGIDHRGSKCKTPKHFNNISQPKKVDLILQKPKYIFIFYTFINSYLY